MLVYCTESLDKVLQDVAKLVLDNLIDHNVEEFLDFEGSIMVDYDEGQILH